MAQPASVATTFPLPSDRKAPRFNGTKVEDFIVDLQLLADLHTVDHGELPQAVTRYATSKVKQVLVADPVFKGKDWPIACARLRDLYGSASERRKCTPSRLREFVDDYREQHAITSRKKLDSYRLKFAHRLGTMIADKRLTEDEVNYLFFSGMRKSLRSAILPTLEMACSKRGVTFGRDYPATLEETLAAARTHLHAQDANNVSDEEDSDDDSQDGDSDASGSDSSDSDEDSDDNGRSRKSKSKHSKSKTKAKPKKTKPSRSYLIPIQRSLHGGMSWSGSCNQSSCP
ncbi:hypothetical protein LXA43DRAFT_905428 [Ganoderma leucocontextum]|nr:hypothetical protein LXA43DRAFT_905428 [Ganoderma leucocontextum]